MSHPFDRYAAFTDVSALKEASTAPLRKSLRVNTLKSSIENFRKWAELRGWKLEVVPWCKEGFFVCLDTPDRVIPSVSRETRSGTRHDTTEAFGRDLLHQLGHTYIQEAASMLPVELLDPKPGETILDLCSAPGSKTTQIAAKMRRVTPSAADPALDTMPLAHAHGTTRADTGQRCIEGVLVANDIQENRLWTLKQALHRSGVTNAIVTKKVGQWFSKHMTERFDRVLCDAPCTAQGILRKDPGAIIYSSESRIEKMATMQYALLESAIHATKVGGRIVYSTCTLTPEENEGIVAAILAKFSGKVEAVDPSEVLGSRFQVLGKALEGSRRVQEKLAERITLRQSSGQAPNEKRENLQPLLRLWPHTFDTEGFFCAVLRKVARTREPMPMERMDFQEKQLQGDRLRDVRKFLERQFGTDFLEEGDCLFERGENLLLATSEVAKFSLPMTNYSLGLPFAKVVGENRLRLEHEIAILRGSRGTKNTLELAQEALSDLLQGRDIACPLEVKGDVLLRFGSYSIGIGLAKEGLLKNRLPRWFVKQAG